MPFLDGTKCDDVQISDATVRLNILGFVHGLNSSMKLERKELVDDKDRRAALVDEGWEEREMIIRMIGRDNKMIESAIKQ